MSKTWWICCSVAGYDSVFAWETQFQRVTSLILHKEKYNPEDLQCLYEEKKKLCMQCGKKKKNDRWQIQNCFNTSPVVIENTNCCGEG